MVFADCFMIAHMVFIENHSTTGSAVQQFRTLRRKSKNFLRQPLRMWFIPVWLLLGLAKALIFIVSFRRLAPRLGVPLGPVSWVPLLDPEQERMALNIGRIVRMAARYTPWNSNCFPQAAVARLLLGIYGIPYALYFGLMREPSSTQLKAHAWVAAGRIRVTGGESFGRFTTVCCFVAPGLQGAAES